METRTPVILTTSHLLTTGVDAPTCKNIVLVRTVGSMPEFKQIIGRGTRLRPDYGKLAFNIIDYTGTATEKFADPTFDGQPLDTRKETLSLEGEVLQTEVHDPPDETGCAAVPEDPPEDSADDLPRKFYVDGGEVEIIRHLVYELDPEGKKLACRRLTDYTGDKVRTLYPNAPALRRDWLDTDRRAGIVEQLAERGIDLETLAQTAGNPEADAFDLLCHLAYNAPLRTRRERADRVKREENEHAWRVDVKGLVQRDDQGRVTACNLDVKNPHAGETADHRSPAEIVDGIIDKERRILALMDELKATLAEGV